MNKVINTPLTDMDVNRLTIGDRVLINGLIYTARDAAHKRLVEMIKNNEKLPMDIEGQVIYYVGPCPAKPGQTIGSAGPTTSGRMDHYTDILLDKGLKGMIGKGMRNKKVINSIIKNNAVYFAAIGGAGALLAEAVEKAEVIAFPDLGAEAIYKLEVKNFPAIVAIDNKGNDLYKTGKEKYGKSNKKIQE